jgi:squalene cyclase
MGKERIERGRNWILDHGGATAITSWGKMWLSVENLFLYLVSLNSELNVCWCSMAFI